VLKQNHSFKFRVSGFEFTSLLETRNLKL